MQVKKAITATAPRDTPKPLLSTLRASYGASSSGPSTGPALRYSSTSISSATSGNSLASSSAKAKTQAYGDLDHLDVSFRAERGICSAGLVPQGGRRSRPSPT